MKKLLPDNLNTVGWIVEINVYIFKLSHFWLSIFLPHNEFYILLLPVFFFSQQIEVEGKWSKQRAEKQKLAYQNKHHFFFNNMYIFMCTMCGMRGHKIYVNVLKILNVIFCKQQTPYVECECECVRKTFIA